MPTCIKNWIQNITRTIIAVFLSLQCFGQPVNLKPEIDIHSGLRSNFIYSLKTDETGSVWIGTEKGIDLLGSQTSAFLKIKNIIGDAAVWTIEFTKKHVFVGTRFNGLYIFDKQSGNLFQTFDSTQIGLCRRIKTINDTIYLATKSIPFYFTFTSNKWKIHKIKSIEKEGFFTDFCQFNNKIYVTKYQQLKSFLYQIINDSLVISKDIQINKHYEIPRNALSITSNNNKMLIGGDGFYQITDINGKTNFKILSNKERIKYYPSWDVCLLHGVAYIGIGNPDNMQEGMLYSEKQSTSELKNNFYIQTLQVDQYNKGLWIGTANRGLFYWQYPSQSIELVKDEYNDGYYYSNKQDLGLIFNSKKISIVDWEKKNAKKIFQIDPSNFKLHTIFDAITWNDTIAILTSYKLLLYSLNGIKIGDYNYLNDYKQSANKIIKIENRLILFTNFFDNIFEVDLKKRKIKKQKLNSIYVSPKPYQNGIIFSSYSTGFHFYDTTAHSFKKSPITFESYCIQKDKIWTINNGILKSYKIDLKTKSLTEILEINYQKRVQNFYPTWINTASDKVFIGNALGFIEIDTKNGYPLRFNYIGNFSVVKPPASDGKNLIFNFENFITKINPDLNDLPSVNNIFKYDINPKGKIYQNSSFSIGFYSSNYLQIKNTLKEILIFKNKKIIDTIYTISNKIELPNGLLKGNYTFEIKANGITMPPLSISIKTELLDSPYFYAVLVLIMGLIIFLFFRNMLIKKSYERQILNNRLQLLKQNLNPHFVFNSLNLIYSLVLQKRNDAAIKTIGSFSDLHRYFLDNVNQTEINLSEELKFIESYLKLEAQRVENDNQFEFFLPKDLSTNILQFLVPPMILQPLVENAVKYSTNGNDLRKIWIEIIQKENKLIVAVENTINDLKKDNSHGLGINLVKERIEIYNKTFNKNVRLETIVNPSYANPGFRSEIIFPF